MRPHPIPHLSAEHFFELYENVPEKYELINGQPVLKFGEAEMMAGGSGVHNIINGNIFAALHRLFKGTTCRPFGPDMGVKINWDSILYPDISIFCDPRNFVDGLNVKAFPFPCVVFEVLSPSTAAYDRGEKLIHYQSIETVRHVFIIDGNKQRITHHSRTSDTIWMSEVLAPGTDIRLTDPALTLTALEIFDLT
jgi:Uma2 family endonuclease